MIPILEDRLKQLLESEVAKIRANPEILDQVFNSSSKPVGKLKEYLRNPDKILKVVNGFPMEAHQLPCFTVILGGESESPEGLGDIDDEVEDSELLVDVEEEVEVSVDSKGRKFLQASKVPVREVISITPVGDGVPVSWSSSGVDSGKIQVQSRVLTGGGLYKVKYKYATGLSVGEVYQFDVNYRVEVWGANSELVVMLYTLLKYVILSNKTRLTNEGWRNLVISGTDFEPVPEYFPVFVFRRTLMLNAKIINTVEVPCEVVEAINVAGGGIDEEW